MNKFFLENRNFTVELWFATSAVFADFKMAFCSNTTLYIIVNVMNECINYHLK